MTLIDSVDSIIMLYSYAGFPDRSFALFEKRAHTSLTADNRSAIGRVISRTPSKASAVTDEIISQPPVAELPVGDNETELAQNPVDEERARLMRVKRNAMSTLSILLTLMSILVAFT
jgi:nickel/cobalt transporter (NiCoT) family protein